MSRIRRNLASNAARMLLLMRRYSRGRAKLALAATLGGVVCGEALLERFFLLLADHGVDVG